MGFIMDGLDAEAYDRTYTDRQLFRRIAGYLYPQRGWLFLITTLVILASVLETIYPLLLARALDLLVHSRFLNIAFPVVGWILLASLLAWICNVLRRWLAARVVGNVVLWLRRELFAALMRNDMSFFDTFPSGTLISRVTTDTESLTTVFTLSLDLLGQTLIFVFLLGVLFFISPRLTLLTCVILPAILGVTLLFRYLARNSTRRAQRSLALLNKNIQEVMSGITVAKNYRQEQKMYNIFKRINWQSYRVGIHSSFLYSGVYPVLVTIVNLGTTLVVYFGGLNVLDHTISAGEWFLFVQSISLLWNPLTSIASFWSQFQLGLAASERIFALLDTEPRVRQTDTQPVEHLVGKIEFKDLFFSYDDKRNILAGFNLTIQAGEKVALVGHTGAGKTSVGRLVARFYEFQGGQLLIDGRNIREFDLQTYRSHVGVVPQVPFIFSGTVADNIRFARPAASEEEVRRAAQSIGQSDWLAALPQGLDTQVGDTGKALSTGQKQLIALARVLLQNPEIVILDEATASIDPLTEMQLQEGLDVLLRGRTAIVIAHRLSTIQNADRIFVMNKGRILEEGKHNKLIEQGGYYAYLYNTYFRHQASDYNPGEGFVPVMESLEGQTGSSFSA
jgi:ABC-type multidrug transport system fused ATPase/permease subunit